MGGFIGYVHRQPAEERPGALIESLLDTVAKAQEGRADRSIIELALAANSPEELKRALSEELAKRPQGTLARILNPLNPMGPYTRGVPSAAGALAGPVVAEEFRYGGMSTAERTSARRVAAGIQPPAGRPARAPAPFTLSPGQTRFGPAGGEIAAVAPEKEPFAGPAGSARVKTTAGWFDAAAKALEDLQVQYEDADEAPSPLELAMRAVEQAGGIPGEWPDLKRLEYEYFTAPQRLIGRSVGKASLAEAQALRRWANNLAKQQLGTAAAGTSAPVAAGREAKIKVRSPEGRRGTIPLSDWPEAQREGYVRIP